MNPCRRALLGLSGLSGLLLRASAELVSGDAAALVQTAVRSHGGAEQGGLLQSRVQMLAELGKGAEQAAFDCAKYPAWCGEPFNCQVPRKPEIPHAKDGHADLGTWCQAPGYYPYAKACLVDKDLKTAAQVQYQWSVDNRGTQGGVDEMDASYCFIEGHCSNEAVTENTTLEEAEKMCDFRYGHNGWAHWNVWQEPRGIASGLFIPGMMSNTTGFHDRKITRIFLKLACAMGNYHCDVMYCKETYCKKDYYVNKYKHLMPKTPGHLLKQRFGPF